MVDVVDLKGWILQEMTRIEKELKALQKKRRALKRRIKALEKKGAIIKPR